MNAGRTAKDQDAARDSARDGPAAPADNPATDVAQGADKRHTVSGASMRKVFVTLIWPRRWLLLLGLVLIVINRLSGLVLPGATKYLIDDVITARRAELLAGLLAVVAGAIAVQSVSSFALTRLLSVEAQQLIARLRARIQEHVLHLPVASFDQTRSGVLVSRIMSDVEGVRNLVGTGFVQLVGGVLTAVVALVLLLRIDAVLTGLTVLPLALFGLIALKAFAFIRPVFRQRFKLQADVSGRLTETMGGIRVVKGFGAEGPEQAVFAGGVQRLFENVRRTLTASALVTSLATLLLGVGSVAVMGLGARRILAEQLTLGDFVSFTLYVGFLVAPIVQMASIGTQITDAFAGLDRVEDLLATPREGAGEDRPEHLPQLRGDVAFEDVHFAYERGKPVLHGVSLLAEAGTVTALVGSSGSGKSTLAGLAASFLRPTSGVVRVDGIDLARVDLHAYRSRLGVVLQDDFLFEGTIRENLLFARPDASEEQLQSAMRAAYVHEFVDQLEQGLDTLIGERGVKLSGGQRQRVSIARALLANPRILILDEATSSLDAESEAYVQRSLATLMAGRTTFVIAHRLSTIRQAHQILVLEAGLIVERGNHQELMATGGRYHELATLQARI